MKTRFPTFLLSAVLLCGGLNSHAQTVFDVDGDGRLDALSDGMLIARWLLGKTGQELTAGALSESAVRRDGAAVAAYLQENRALLDVDGNTLVEPLKDGLLIVRYLFGFRGADLTNGAIGAHASRSPEQIAAYLAAPSTALSHITPPQDLDFSNFRPADSFDAAFFPELNAFDTRNDYVFLKLYIPDSSAPSGENLLHLGRVTDPNALSVTVELPRGAQTVYYEIFSAGGRVQGTISL